MNYYSLLVKYESKSEPWQNAFGDYDKEVVSDERTDSYAECVATKIICTDAAQASIDAAVAKCNAK